MKLTLRIVNADDLLAEQDRTRVWDGEGGSIGRISGNDWVLPDPRSEISRVHARVYFKNDLYYIEDLSTNGVFVGDQNHRVDRVPYALSNGDILYIGHYQIEVEIVDQIDFSSRGIPDNDFMMSSGNSFIDDVQDFDQVDTSAEIPSFSFDDLLPSQPVEPFSPEPKPAPIPQNKSENLIPDDWMSGAGVMDSLIAPNWGASSQPFIPDNSSDVIEVAPPKQEVKPKVQPKPKPVAKEPVVPAPPVVEPSSRPSPGNRELAKHMVAQRVAFDKTLDTILEMFDDDYVDCVILNEGETRQDLSKRLFETVFSKVYKAKLKSIPSE